MRSHAGSMDTTLYRKFETNIPRNSCTVSLSDLYIPSIDPPILLYCVRGPIHGNL
jgi:hypothetical protein